MPAKPKNSPETAHISTILPDVIRSCRREKDTGMMVVWDNWDRAVGADIARNTQPAAFKGQLLLVHVSSSVWLHRLQFMKADLIDRINTACGCPLVSRMTFKIGPLEKESPLET